MPQMQKYLSREKAKQLREFLTAVDVEGVAICIVCAAACGAKWTPRVLSQEEITGLCVGCRGKGKLYKVESWQWS
jgi:hypothetical protein